MSETRWFKVLVREVHVQTVTVRASNAEEAIQLVRDGDGEYKDNSLEYSHTLPKDTWTTELAE